MDSSDSSRVKWDRGHHNRGVAPEGATRAATDRPVRDRKHPFYRCSGRTYLGNRLSPSSGPIDSQNRWRDRTELESNPPTSQRACTDEVHPNEHHNSMSRGQISPRLRQSIIDKYVLRFLLRLSGIFFPCRVRPHAAASAAIAL